MGLTPDTERLGVIEFMKQQNNGNLTFNKILILWIITILITISLALLFVDSYNHQRDLVKEQEDTLRRAIAGARSTASHFISLAEIDGYISKEYLNELLYEFREDANKNFNLGAKDIAHLSGFCYELGKYQYDIEDPEEMEILIVALAEISKDIVTMADIYFRDRGEDFQYSNLGLVRKVKGKDKEFNKERDAFFRGLHDRYYIDLREQLGNR